MQAQFCRGAVLGAEGAAVEVADAVSIAAAALRSRANTVPRPVGTAALRWPRATRTRGGPRRPAGRGRSGTPARRTGAAARGSLSDAVLVAAEAEAIAAGAAVAAAGVGVAAVAAVAEAAGGTERPNK